MNKSKNNLDQLFSFKINPYTFYKAPNSPPVDIIELDDRFEVIMDLPGVKIDDVTIKANNGLLLIAGERLNQSPKSSILRNERFSGGFMRNFQLDDNLDTENIVAEYEQGVLTIKIPKLPKAMPKNIQIKQLDKFLSR